MELENIYYFQFIPYKCVLKNDFFSPKNAAERDELFAEILPMKTAKYHKFVKNLTLEENTNLAKKQILARAYQIPFITTQKKLF